MNKPYLLIAGDCHYPQAGDGDWVGFFETYEDAKAQVEIEVREDLFTRGPRKGQVKSTSKYYKVNGRSCDWY